MYTANSGILKFPAGLGNSQRPAEPADPAKQRPSAMPKHQKSTGHLGRRPTQGMQIGHTVQMEGHSATVFYTQTIKETCIHSPPRTRPDER